MAFTLKMNVDGANRGYMRGRNGRSEFSHSVIPGLYRYSMSEYPMQPLQRSKFYDNEERIKFGSSMTPLLNTSTLPIPIAVNNGIIGGWLNTTVMPVEEKMSSYFPRETEFSRLGFESGGGDFLQNAIQALGPAIYNPRREYTLPTRGNQKHQRYRTITEYWLDTQRRVYSFCHDIRNAPGKWDDGAILPDTVRTGYSNNYCTATCGEGLPKPGSVDACVSVIHSNNNVIELELRCTSNDLYAISGGRILHRHHFAFVHLIGHNNILIVNYHGNIRLCKKYNEGQQNTFGTFVSGSNNMVITASTEGSTFEYNGYNPSGLFFHMGTRDPSNALFLGNYQYNYKNIGTAVNSILRLDEKGAGNGNGLVVD